MVRHVISRRLGDYDRFSISLLRHWAIEHMKELAEHLTVLLSKSKSRNASQPRKGLRQRYVMKIYFFPHFVKIENLISFKIGKLGNLRHIEIRMLQ